METKEINHELLAVYFKNGAFIGTYFIKYSNWWFRNLKKRQMTVQFKGFFYFPFALKVLYNSDHDNITE